MILKMSGKVAKFEETGYESELLYRAFLECDPYICKWPASAAPASREVPISAIIQYLESNLLSCRIHELGELQNLLESVTSDGFVNWKQFQDIMQKWIFKFDVFKWQDGNNNGCKERQRNNGLHSRIQRFEEENASLREEATKAEELVRILQRQRDALKHKLDLYIEKYHQLEQENDEQTDFLSTTVRNERIANLALKKSLSENKLLQLKLEAAEVEIQVISPLKEKLDKLERENNELARRIQKIQSDFEEKQQECIELQSALQNLGDNYVRLQEAQEQIIRDLREKNMQLTDENTEIRSLWTMGVESSEIEVPISPIQKMKDYTIYDTQSGSGQFENSLYFELKASGFTTECSRNDAQSKEPDENMNINDVRLLQILKELDISIRQITESFGINYAPDPELENVDYVDEKVFEKLMQKLSFLAVTAKKIAPSNANGQCITQFPCTTWTTNDFRAYGILTYYDLQERMNTRQNYPKIDYKMQCDMLETKIAQNGSGKVRRTVSENQAMGPVSENVESSSEECKEVQDTSIPVPLSSSTSVHSTEPDSITIQSSEYSSTDSGFNQPSRNLTGKTISHPPSNENGESSTPNIFSQPLMMTDQLKANISHRAGWSFRNPCNMTRILVVWRSVLCCIVIFCMGFYMRHVLSVANNCNPTFTKWWSFEEAMSPYLYITKKLPPPL